MKKYSGNLMAYLNEQTKNAVQDRRDGEYTIQNIDAHKIIPNQRNFYGIRDVEGLAASMALSGHISPLEVIPREDGTYTLISGERRRAAVLLRFQRGEVENAEVPCIVRENLSGSDKLTAEQMEIVNIICANDYREKTPFEKLSEVTELEPIARIYYEEEHAKGFEGDFRKFFAEKFLGISIGTLQRILVFRKLVPEAKEAFDRGLIRKTALSELAYQPEEVQREYLEKLLQGEASGTIEEVQRQGQEQEETAEDETVPGGEKDSLPETEEEEELPAMPDAALEEGHGENEAMEDQDDDREEEPTSEDTGDIASGESSAVPSRDTEKAPAVPLSPEEAQKEADSWVQEGICNMMLQAAEEAEKAQQRGDSRAAAQWDLRRAAANLILETIR